MTLEYPNWHSLPKLLLIPMHHHALLEPWPDDCDCPCTCRLTIFTQIQWLDTIVTLPLLLALRFYYRRHCWRVFRFLPRQYCFRQFYNLADFAAGFRCAGLILSITPCLSAATSRSNSFQQTAPALFPLRIAWRPNYLWPFQFDWLRSNGACSLAQLDRFGNLKTVWRTSHLASRGLVLRKRVLLISFDLPFALPTTVQGNQRSFCRALAVRYDKENNNPTTNAWAMALSTIAHTG